ncbi:MAG: hypothetical protein ABGX04_14230 [Myxococcales bacterium]|nr:hypothetical protein [Myxococcales bacterium]
MASTSSFETATGPDVDEEGSPPTSGQTRAAKLFPKVSDKDEADLSRVLLLHVALVAGLLSVFAAAEAWATVSGLALASVLSIVDGLLVGAAVAALLHEWGHFLGARLAGGHSPLKPIGGFFPVFDFDYQKNDARAFDWMSIGGNAGDIGVVLLFFFALPLTTAGTTALVAGSFGFAVFAAAIEFPVIQKSRAGMPATEALLTIPRGFTRRYTRWGIAAALAAFAIL